MAFSEKPSALSLGASGNLAAGPSCHYHQPRSPHCPRAYPPLPPQFSSSSAHRSHSLSSQCFMRKWLPILSYTITTLGFLVAIAFYRDELFASLDELSSWLRTYQGQEWWNWWIDGKWILGALIFLTTIPPFPLYSTLIVLSGYTFSWSEGAVISYISALLGAVFVYLVSRHFSSLNSCIQAFLHSSPHLRKAVKAIEKNNRLLFLIRLAPYPYNVMNCLLAASKVKLRTFVGTTALSLVKVVIHTSVGASIHSFKSYHNHKGSGEDSEEEKQGRFVAKLWTAVGIALCIGILGYLSFVARRAVDSELDDDEDETAISADERVLFLADDEPDLETGMVESPFSRGAGTIHS